jgi:nucleosome binding factor SPN SPT16 subunit
MGRKNVRVKSTDDDETFLVPIEDCLFDSSQPLITRTPLDITVTPVMEILKKDPKDCTLNELWTVLKSPEWRESVGLNPNISEKTSDALELIDCVPTQ